MPDGLTFTAPTRPRPRLLLTAVLRAHRIFAWLTEWFHPPRKAAKDEDETVARDGRTPRRFRDGRPALPIRCSPDCTGAKHPQLSVRAVLPRFADIESKHGSLGRAMLKARKKMGAGVNLPARPLFTSLKDGMQQMVDALVARLERESRARKPRPCQSINPRIIAGTVCSQLPDRPRRCRHHRHPDHAAAALLEATDENLARGLERNQYGFVRSPSRSVTTKKFAARCRQASDSWCRAVKAAVCSRPPSSTTISAPRAEVAPWSVACSAARGRAVLQSSESDILQIVRGELRQILGAALDPEPLFRARLQMEVRHGPVFRRPPRTPAAYRSAPPEAPRLGARRQRLQTASAVRTAFAPAPRRPARSSPRWACGRQPSPPASHRGRL